MNMILAFLPPYRLERVALRLHALPGFPGMTVSEARGHGHEKGQDDQDSRSEMTDYTPTVRIEIVVPDEFVEPIMSTIYEAAHTGERGDGKVYVLPVSDALRIKTGQRGGDAM